MLFRSCDPRANLLRLQPSTSRRFSEWPKLRSATNYRKRECVMTDNERLANLALEMWEAFPETRFNHIEIHNLVRDKLAPIFAELDRLRRKMAFVKLTTKPRHERSDMSWYCPLCDESTDAYCDDASSIKHHPDCPCGANQ